MHEWEYNVEEQPRKIINKLGEISFDKPEPVQNLITWIYEIGSFVPCAKIVGNECFSIINDYIGRPILAFDKNGEQIWSAEYDIYGGLRNLKGEKDFIPFRQLGQYEDIETGLYYNRFRYYNPETGIYISKDPIGLAGGLSLYAYVKDINRFVDIFGLLQGSLLAIQSKINTILEAHLPQILKIDPNATIGYRGSSASGISKIHNPKLSKPINLNSFDVDAFIKSDYLANFFDNRMRYANEISGILEIEQSIQQQLKQAFPNNDFKGEPFGFRIFKSYELDEYARKGDIQIHIKCRN